MLLITISVNGSNSLKIFILRSLRGDQKRRLAIDGDLEECKATNLGAMYLYNAYLISLMRSLWRIDGDQWRAMAIDGDRRRSRGV